MVRENDRGVLRPVFVFSRVITLNGIEVEAALFSHQFGRHTTNMDLKRQLARVRRLEPQTMNFYMNMGNRPPLARGLYLEIAMIEEQNVSHYESMMEAGATTAGMRMAPAQAFPAMASNGVLPAPA